MPVQQMWVLGTQRIDLCTCMFSMDRGCASAVASAPDPTACDLNLFCCCRPGLWRPESALLVSTSSRERGSTWVGGMLWAVRSVREMTGAPNHKTQHHPACPRPCSAGSTCSSSATVCNGGRCESMFPFLRTYSWSLFFFDHLVKAARIFTPAHAPNLRRQGMRRPEPAMLVSGARTCRDLDA